jgi:hypothetical protein
MTDGSKHRPNITAGVDTGDKHSYLCLLDTASGEVMEEGRLRATPEAFRRRCSSEQPMRIAIEAGTHSPWVSRLLEECGHEVCHANLVRPPQEEQRPLRRLQRLWLEKTDPIMHRVTGELARRECGWKHSAKGRTRYARL